ncbi:hypothetical protein FB567DRAFT_516877 [Paraphoma chrysanthemicola]|uniref:Tat pathway signal sequence n=1 Tax=Paraphoma chrysanthemicola TaxID=798071 RepID=A0A8K0W290_9PLEO|nr:hypothetical protein FB567DRAFT_516877 [Paraphoma chrysanthemicola]
MEAESHENEYDAPLLRAEKSSWDDSGRNRRRWKCRGVVLHSVIASLYFLAIAAVFWRYRPRSSCPQCDLNLYSPASEVLEYSERIMTMDPETFAAGNPFIGEPRPELDNAWDELLQNIQISVTPTEFANLQPQLNRSTLRLPDGSYMIRLRVYHELHCLKWIRKWMHREHYWPDLSGYALHERRWHIEHCLEDLRRSVMCQPSLAPSTFEFLDRKTSDAITADGTHVAKCANWDALDEWAAKRSIDLTTLDRKSLSEE